MGKNQIFWGIIFIPILFVISCNKEKKAEINDQGYVVEGIIKNMPDSTWIYLGNNKEKDSTLIIGEKFTFSGTVEEPEPKYISLEDFTEGFIYLWVEDTIVTIQAERGDLKNAKIKGGKTQRESEISQARNKLLRTEYDSIIRWHETGRVTNANRDSIGKRSKRIFELKDSISISFVREFPDSYLSISDLTYLKTKIPRDSTKKLFAQLSEEIQNSKNGLLIQHYLTLPETPKIGEKFVDFELQDTEGNVTKLSDNLGKYTLLEFWAAWCGPCRRENPNLRKTYNLYKNNGFEIFGVSLDERKDDWINAIQKDSLPWVQVSDLEGFETEPAMIYNVEGIPHNLLIDPEGNIIAKNLRGKGLDKKLKEVFDSI